MMLHDAVAQDWVLLMPQAAATQKVSGAHAAYYTRAAGCPMRCHSQIDNTVLQCNGFDD